MIAKVRREWQITLPEDVIRMLEIREGSVLDCRVEKGEIRLRPDNHSKRGIRTKEKIVSSLLKAG